MIGEALAARWLKEAFQNGGYLTLHSGDPAATGTGQIGQRLRFGPGSFAFRSRLATNPGPLELERITQEGYATWFGLWTLQGEWIKGAIMRRPQTVRSGMPVRIGPGEIVVRLS